MSQYIPPTLFHFSTGTITEVAGQQTDMICEHRAAANQTTLITIPIVIPSNSRSIGVSGRPPTSSIGRPVNF